MTIEHSAFPLHSEDHTEIFGALLAAQKDFGPLYKTDTAHKYKYATLEKIIEHVNPVLHAHGLMFFQSCVCIAGADYCCTQLSHTSGQWMRSYVQMILGNDKLTPMQSLGSSYSYARRYGLQACLGIQPSKEDDDGQSMGDWKTRDHRSNKPRNYQHTRPPGAEYSRQLRSLYNLTVSAVEKWCGANNITQRWTDWPLDSKARFLDELRDGTLTTKMILNGEARS